jgi:hypothetical protein
LDQALETEAYCFRLIPEKLKTTGPKETEETKGGSAAARTGSNSSLPTSEIDKATTRSRTKISGERVHMILKCGGLKDEEQKKEHMEREGCLGVVPRNQRHTCS